MCGIIGGLHDGSIDSYSVGMAMLESIRHRGPDAGYLHMEDGVFLGVRRLAIINPAWGPQPVRNETGNLLAVLNGEIYNYRELHDQLTRAGHHLAPGSDAEVIPHAFEQWGNEFPKHLNGDFAIAIWDGWTRQLTLVRDRVGVKPLFYARTRDGLVFASEVKAILAHPAVDVRLNPSYFAQLFTYWVGLETESAFAGVHEIATGQIQSFNAAGRTVNRQRYWEIPYRSTVASFQGSFSACQDEFRQVLRRAVALRLQADVPVGTYTSGGVDSSIINVLAYGDLGHHHRATFSVSFDDPVLDESAHQELLISHLGLRGHRVRCSGHSIYRAMPDVIYHAESPLFRTAAAPMYLLSQLVAETGVKVVLTGEGSDEVAWGYDIFREAKIRRFWSRQPDSEIRPQLLRKLYAYLPQFQNPRHFRLLLEFFSIDMQRTSDPLYSHHTRFANSRATHPLLCQAMMQELEIRPPIEILAASLPSDFAQRSPLEKCQYLEMRTLLQGYLLSSQGDRMLSAHGVEGRFPFLDHHVIEFLASLPERFRLRGLRDKAILRDTFQQDLPRSIISRPKFAFRAPALAAFLEDVDGFVAACLEPSAIKNAGIFDAAAVANFLDRLRKLPTERYSTRDHLAFVHVLSTQLLHDQFVGARQRSPAAPHDVTVTFGRGTSGPAAA